MLTFPDPSVETEYTDPNGSVWQFNGTGWVRQPDCPDVGGGGGGLDGSWPAPVTDGVFALTTRNAPSNRNCIFLKVIDEKIVQVGSVSAAVGQGKDSYMFCWSPCGKKFFWNTKQGLGDGTWKNEIHNFVEGDNAGADTLINTNSLAVGEAGEWSPDGKTIATARQGVKSTKLIRVIDYETMAMTDGDEVFLYSTPHNGVAYNPNSSMIVAGNTGGNTSDGNKDVLMKFLTSPDGSMGHVYQAYREDGAALKGITFCNRENLFAVNHQSTTYSSVTFHKDMGTHYEHFGGTGFTNPIPAEKQVPFKSGGFSPDGQMYGSGCGKYSGRGNFRFFRRQETRFSDGYWGNALAAGDTDGLFLQWTPDSRYAVGVAGNNVVLFRREEDDKMTFIPDATYASPSNVYQFKAQPFRTDRGRDTRSDTAADLEARYGKQDEYAAEQEAMFQAYEAQRMKDEG